ncbi:hypothetical protein FSARC_11393 [Fusarium sarcochroum]|uniref:RING-type E3 ubiquitin transferase n=1 Tax=Fusarium sarcochroum TaxID=1208366 RepID=A0A8H4TFU4_9HYPO|nr:hypothetical protein FSARC_11393 [Fusarium sarcochroum]
MAPPEGDNNTGVTSSDSQPQGDGQRNRGRGRGRGNQNRRGGQRRGRGGNNANVPNVPANPAAQDVAAAASRAHAIAASKAAEAAEEDEDGEVCFICANPVAHHSIAPCNHTTCHICGLRMRALYKTKDCAHCRTPAPYVIFTDDPEKRFEEYSEKDITTTDSNIGIKYTKEDIVGDTVLLLRYNCPDASCDFAGLGWPDLHRHVKSAHRKRMCDLCTRNKRVFTHEHELFADKELEKHMRHGDDKPGAADQTGFKGHPLCGFCGERFYDDDKLYEHCRMKHERCFICDRRDSRHPHYYLDYNALEEHFKKDHYPCGDRECLEKKFIVYESELDLQAHQLEEHGGKATGRDARVVNISGFDIRTPYQQERGGGGREEGGRRGGREGRRGGNRGRDPNAEPVPVSSAQPLRRDEIAFQRQMAIHSAQSVSNRTFGGSLSAASPTPAQASSQPRGGSSAATPRGSQTNLANPIESATVTDTANLGPEEQARILRHNSVVERASNLLGNDTQRMATFRNHVSSYRQGGLTAPQLIDAFFTLFADVSSNALGTLVREVADLYEDKGKADALRKAWQDWRAINEDYPSLPGLSGMHGATSSSSGWANAATTNPAVPNAKATQKYSNRVLKLKNSTRLGGPAPVSSSGASSWAARPAVNPPATASSAFPSLPSTGGSSSASRSNWTAPAPSSSSQSTTLNRPRPAPRPTGEDAFPALPTAAKPTTTIFGYGNGRAVRRDYGHRETGFQWGSGSGPSTPAGEEPADNEEAGGKKKGGKKGKKVLVQWG